MPLSDDETKELRNLSADKHVTFYAKRIALTLEDILSELRVMNDRASEGRPGEGRNPFDA